MKWTLEAFYQSQIGAPHEKVDFDRLSDYVGPALAAYIVLKADDRMKFRELPEVNAFFEHGGRQVITVDLTNRGTVYIEAVELPEST